MEAKAVKSLKSIQTYLSRQFEELSVPASSSDALPLAICIPAYKELGITDTLNSLELSFKRWADPKLQLKVYLHLNAPESDALAQDFHEKQEADLLAQHQSFKTVVLKSVYPDKKAGVGRARKEVMDFALKDAFENTGNNGYLVCLDGDCTVSPNYLEALEKHLLENPNANAGSLYFEHILDGLTPERKDAIAAYEGHLRLYRQWLIFAAHPYAYHTVGSSMYARMEAYAKQGGMNTKKAGEDFYFLNKLMHLGHFVECNNLTVYPSARNSTRVPFGTGRAMEDIESGKKQTTYHPQIFLILKALFVQLKTGSLLLEDPNLKFLDQQFNLRQEIEGLKKNTASHVQFLKRLFQKVDLFYTMKMIHALRDWKFPNVSIPESFRVWQAQAFGLKKGDALDGNLIYILKKLREVEKKN